MAFSTHVPQANITKTFFILSRSSVKLAFSTDVPQANITKTFILSRSSVKLAFITDVPQAKITKTFILSRSSVKLAFSADVQTSQLDLYLVSSEGSYSPHEPVFTCIHVRVHVHVHVHVESVCQRSRDQSLPSRSLVPWVGSGHETTLPGPTGRGSAVGGGLSRPVVGGVEWPPHSAFPTIHEGGVECGGATPRPLL